LLRFATLRGQPLGRVARTLLAVLAAAEPAATETVRLTILLVMPHRPAGRLRERDRGDLPAYLRQPGPEAGLGRETGNREPRLHASIIPSSDRTLGWIRSTCVMPRRQPFHVPYCSFRASTPQLDSSCTAQSTALS